MNMITRSLVALAASAVALVGGAGIASAHESHHHHHHAGPASSGLACWIEPKVDLPAEKVCGQRSLAPSDARDFTAFPAR